MFQNLKLRTKLVAIAVPPLVVLGLIAAYSVILSRSDATSIDELTGDISTLGVVSLAAFLISALTILVIGRSISDPIEDASAAARELADVRLPALLETLRNPGASTPEFTPLAGGKNDEMADLVESLNAVQSGIVELSNEQRTIVRKGLSELVVNLARRNQSLLDRQIEVIDQLEAAEEDPDRLEELFGLDHLATRMRRNAESLLVVAGAEPARRKGGPVAVADVLRVAMSEIEDYRHVQLVSIEDAEISPQAAVDLAHLFSELLENATQFSPPDSPVELTGTFHPSGSYMISCVDHGIGMTAEQLAMANEVLVNPPELGLGLTRSLGFIVIGRLAERLGVQVELTHTSSGGITAIAEVPASVLGGAPTAALDSAPMPAPMETEQPAAPAVAETSLPTPALDANPFGIADEEEGWTPPALPERGAASFETRMPETPDVAAPAVQDIPSAPMPSAPTPSTPIPSAPMPEAPVAPSAPAFDTPAAPAPMPSTPMPAAADAGASVGADAPSDALAKLLGIAPDGIDGAAPAAPTAPPVESPSTPEAGSSNSMIFGRAADEAAPAPEPETQWSAPVFDPSALEVSHEPVALDSAPAQLEQAIPSGDNFDAGVNSLLQDGPTRTASGLVKRDRSKSSAPVSEGRVIPEPAGRAVASSVRSPDEIRSMLARYRSGLKGKPLTDIAGSQAPGAPAPAPATPAGLPPMPAATPAPAPAPAPMTAAPAPEPAAFGTTSQSLGAFADESLDAFDADAFGSPTTNGFEFDPNGEQS